MSTRSDILIRGDAATRAVPVDLIHRSGVASVSPVGPWAEKLDETRMEARNDGMAEGWQEGRRLGLHESRVENERRAKEMVVSFDRMMNQLQEYRDELEQELVAKAVDVALEVAALVLDREIAASTEPGLDAIGRCLAIAPDATDLVARLHPDSAAQMEQVMEVAGRRVSIVADPTLAVGDAVVRADDSIIDGRISEALKRVAQVLA